MTQSRQDRAATRIGDAVQGWLATLDPGHRSRAVFPFDTPERFIWDYRPGVRQGLSLAEMTTRQRAAAMAIIDVVLSERGAGEVQAIMALEPLLGELERLAGNASWSGRDPDRYWFAVFGQPGGSSPWSWRVGGHHIAVHSTLADGRVIGIAPSFLGANPATVPIGPFAGRRAIDAVETMARTLLASLSPAQRRLAVVDPVAPPDILTGNGRRADILDVPSGIRYDQLESTQRDALERLVRHYLGRSAPELAEMAWDRVRAADLAPITFAWAGSDLPGRGHYYAICGPNLVIEYDNTQDDANHIHAVWRDLTNDWGEDLLAAHYRSRHGVR